MAACFVLCGYEFLRSASNVLYVSAYTAKKIPLVQAIMPLGVLLVLYIYGRLISWLGPRRTLFWTTFCSGLIIATCYGLIKQGVLFATAVLYIYREAYIVLLIEQYWSFINSTFTATTAKKLNGFIIGFTSLGAILGGYLVSQLAERMGTASMLLFAAGSLIPAAFFSDIAYVISGEPKPSENETQGKQGHLALGLFKSYRILILLLFLVITTQIVSTMLGLSFQNIVQEAIPHMDKQTAYQGKFFSSVNAVAALFQFVAAPVLLSIIPIGIIQLLIPLILILFVGAFTMSPTLQTCSAAYLLFKALDYSLFRASKEILYIPLSFDARYRAKEVIDVFGYRFSKGGSSLVVVLLQNAGIAISAFYGLIALSANLLWVGLMVPIYLQIRKSK